MKIVSTLSFVMSISICTVVVAEETEKNRIREAQESFNRGIALADRMEYEAALAEFERAYRIAPHYLVMFNIGQVKTYLQMYPGAVMAFEEYLEEGGDLIPAERRVIAERELVRLRDFLGSIKFNLQPDVPARIFIDGIDTERTADSSPFLVKIGRHDIEIRAEGFLPYRREVRIAAKQELMIEESMIPVGSPGGILVTSPFVQTRISVDGNEAGETPLEEPITVKPGRHIIKAERPGYQIFRREIEVKAGEVVRVSIQLKLLSSIPEEFAGQLEFEIEKTEHAEIRIDGLSYISGLVPIGQHNIEIESPNHEIWRGEVNILSGSLSRLEVDLVPTEAYREQYTVRARRYRIASFVTGSLGIVMTMVGVGLHFWNYFGQSKDYEKTRLTIQNEYEACSKHSKECSTALTNRYANNLELADRIKNLEIAYPILYGIGASAILTGILFYFLGPHPNRYPKVAVLASQESMMLGIKWCFF